LIGVESRSTDRTRSLFDRIWSRHVVDGPSRIDGAPDTLYIDLHLVHEVTSPQAFDALRKRSIPVARPHQTVATMDHSTPTTPPGADGLYVFGSPDAERQVQQLELNCEEFGVPLHPLGSEHQGIVHVMAPELGLIQPGMTVVCGDSHTSTHGAFGVLSFGIGTGQVAHVLATQCLLAHRPRTLEVRIEGQLQRGVTAKDVILAVIARIGTEGGTGHAIEFTGDTVRRMSMEERMTVCNMAIEAGARAGLVAPDDTTYSYLEDRPFAPQGRAWDAAIADWSTLSPGNEADFDRSVQIAAAALEPMVTWGTSPGMGSSIREPVPDPDTQADAEARGSYGKALEYMGVEPGRPLLGHQVDVVFVGSCTNSRLSDLREAAAVLDGRRVADGVRMLVVPGSQQVKRDAESEGLNEIFLRAGAEWREPGCSMCLAMNGDQLAPGELAVSTSNRNFEGRQGPGGRTVLASPLTAAACAVTGSITDVRELL
jgi:3-isopropylmalate/(R)-2-methylmalate dehydratase large subunit